MAFLPEQTIWINHIIMQDVKIKRIYDKKTDELTIRVRDNSGFETDYHTKHDTVYQKQKADLYHGDRRNGGRISNTVVARFNPIISVDQLAIEVAPSGKIDLAETPPDPKTNILQAQDLINRGFYGFFVDNEKKSLYGTNRQQSIFNLSLVDRIISSPRRNLLLILWKNTNGDIKETHFQFSNVKRWAILTQKEVSQKNPFFSK